MEMALLAIKSSNVSDDNNKDNKRFLQRANLFSRKHTRLIKMIMMMMVMITMIPEMTYSGAMCMLSDSAGTESLKHST